MLGDSSKPLFGLVFTGAFALWDLLTAAWLRRWERTHGSQVLRLDGWSLQWRMVDLHLAPIDAAEPFSPPARPAA
ncbi:MAG: hypothetical protein M3025_09655 [Actinomycetota bacterium]|nr:hypothetical protein [Actinomycetota bacterium]